MYISQLVDDGIRMDAAVRIVTLEYQLATANAMISILRRTSRNVKRWQSGDMCLRWTAAGMLEAERQFRKIIGYKHLAALALAVERDVAAGRAATTTPATAEPAATLVTA